MKIRNYNIGKRLLFVFLLVAILFMGCSAYFLIQLNRIEYLNSDLFNRNLKAIDFLLEADRDAYQSRLAISHSLKNIPKQEREKLKIEIAENLEQLHTRYSKYAEIYNVTAVEVFKNQDSIYQTNHKLLVLYTDSIIQLLDNGDIESASLIYTAGYAKCFDVLRESLNQSTEHLLSNADNDHNTVLSIVKFVFIVFSSASLLLIIFIVLSGILVTRSITKPLAKLIEYSNRLAHGDLGLDIHVAEKDEIAIVMIAYNDMVIKLKEVIGNIRANAEELVNASSAIAATSDSIAQSTNHQAASTEQIAASIEQITGSVNQNSGNSQETERIAKKAALSIDQGRVTMTKLVAAMKEVESKTSVINDIAQKTDLLAINAAVEAARAGELGKGFAVVATEVRSLAVVSQKAASTIAELIKTNLKNVIEFNIQVEEIAADVNKTAQLVQEISATSLEQNTGVTQINESIQQLNTTTQQNSAAAEQLATSASELEGNAANLKGTVNFFILNQKEIADKISDMRTHINYLMSAIDNLEGKQVEKYAPNTMKRKQSYTQMSNKPSGIEINLQQDDVDSQY